MAYSQKTDVFPADVLKTFREVDILPPDTDLKKLSETHLADLYAFIIRRESSTRKVYFFPIEITQNLRKHFRDTAAYLKPGQPYIVPQWDNIVRRITKPVDNIKKNCDVRTAFKFNKNFFLTKASFTFGLRNVKKGTHHIYQIGAVQMTLYFLPWNQRGVRIEKYFCADDQHKYMQRTLEEYGKYEIPENINYVICTLNRTFFSVHVIKSDTVLPFKTVNPITEPNVPRVDRLYAKPIETPMIEEVTLGDSEDEAVSSPKRQYIPETHEQSSSASSSRTQWMPLHSTDTRSTSSQLLMPPPSVPTSKTPQPTLNLVKNFFTPNIPVERNITLADTDWVEWFHFTTRKEYNHPTKGFVPFQSESNEKAIDLTVKNKHSTPEQKNTSKQSTPEQSIQTQFDSLCNDTLQQPGAECTLQQPGGSFALQQSGAASFAQQPGAASFAQQPGAASFAIQQPEAEYHTLQQTGEGFYTLQQTGARFYTLQQPGTETYTQTGAETYTQPGTSSIFPQPGAESYNQPGCTFPQLGAESYTQPGNTMPQTGVTTLIDTLTWNSKDTDFLDNQIEKVVKKSTRAENEEIIKFFNT